MVVAGTEARGRIERNRSISVINKVFRWIELDTRKCLHKMFTQDVFDVGCV